jgi:serine/threonine protein kinase
VADNTSDDDMELDDDAWNAPPPFVPSTRSDEATSASKFHTDLERISSSNDPLLEQGKLSHYQLLRTIGRGGMGTVYAAFDAINDRNVAVKVLHAELVHQPHVRRRFEREARMLAEIDCPFVTKLFELSDTDGYLFLVQELIEGQSLAERISTAGHLSESETIQIGICVTTALHELHRIGIVHRDVKPENILLVRGVTDDAGRVIAKLSDLGIARMEEAPDTTAITSAQSMLGTPLYMSPEHFDGGAQVTDQSDIYSLGATLFHALTGQPPYRADTFLALADAHRHSPTPNPQLLNKHISDAAREVVIKLLQKRVDLRYRSATELLADLQRLQLGIATSVNSHPLLPSSASGRMTSFSFTWEMKSSPEELWPFVSNTERLNRAINLPAVAFSIRNNAAGQRQRIAAARIGGVQMQWLEHMFEWIEAQRMSVLREFERGPVCWMTSVVELARRADGGTTLTHSFRVNCRHLAGLAFVNLQWHALTKRSLDKVYRRIDGVIGSPNQPGASVDAFEESTSLSPRSARLLDRITQRMVEKNLDRAAILKVTDYVRSASAQEVSHIRPRVLAKTLQLPTNAVIDICLHGAHQGLFDLSWDVICPSCRIATTSQDSIENIKKHTRCEACDFDFELNFATNVELIVRVNSQIRKPEMGQYCIGGPAHSPHVAAQTRLAAGETIDLGLELSEGHYVLRGPQLPFSILLDVHAASKVDRLVVDLSSAWNRKSSMELTTQRQLITVSNHSESEILLRIERSSISDDAVTALQAAGLPFFRRYFPNQIPSAQQLASVQNLTFVVVTSHGADELTRRVGEVASCELKKQHLENLVKLAMRFEGAFVRSLDDGGLLVFRNPSSAVAAIENIQDTIPQSNGASWWQPVVVIHQGPVLVTTINGQLEYIGSLLRNLQSLVAIGRPSEIITVIELSPLLVSAGFEMATSQNQTAIATTVIGELTAESSLARFRLPCQ